LIRAADLLEVTSQKAEFVSFASSRSGDQRISAALGFHSRVLSVTSKGKVLNGQERVNYSLLARLVNHTGAVGGGVEIAVRFGLIDDSAVDTLHTEKSAPRSTVSAEVEAHYAARSALGARHDIP
jgi:hypothetical protein